VPREHRGKDQRVQRPPPVDLPVESAIDRLVSTSYELVIEGESYRRRRQRPQSSAANSASR
jgi:hypothetical protein